jgi:hypothetical protein
MAEHESQRSGDAVFAIDAPLKAACMTGAAVFYIRIRALCFFKGGL